MQKDVSLFRINAQKMLKRKILLQLEEWKESSSPKPLILRGARQVGKSTAVNEFGKKYKNFASLNLERSEHARFFLDYGDNVKNIVNAIGLQFNVDLNKEDSLLFIDEIQEIPSVIALLRYFYEDLPHLNVIAAGSLLEFAMGEVPSFPVGRVQQIPVFPLDFEEFLMALGESAALDLLKTIPIPDFAHNKLLELYNKYILIGGMPEVVKTYIENKDNFIKLNKVYASIWDNYRDDIEKYGKSDSEKRVLNHILSTAPAIRDRIIFNGFGGSNYGSREVSDAFKKLHKAGIIKLIYPTNDFKMPITPNLKRKPKIQFLDTGLLNYASNIQQNLLTLTDLNSFHKGYIVNHILFQELLAKENKIHAVPFFWIKKQINLNAKVDAIFHFNGQVYPIEIKSGANGSLKSLHEFMDITSNPIAIRLLSNKFKIEKSITKSGKEFYLINLPYYTIGDLENWISYVSQPTILNQ